MITQINGKTLTKPQSNLVQKLVEKYGVQFSEQPLTAIVYNPCTGVRFAVDENIAVLVSFVHLSYRNYSELGRMQYFGKPVAIGTFDRVRYLILALDASTYSNVID